MSFSSLQFRAAFELGDDPQSLTEYTGDGAVRNWRAVRVMIYIQGDITPRASHFAVLALLIVTAIGSSSVWSCDASAGTLHRRQPAAV